MLQNSKKLLNEAERLELKSKATLLLADVLFDANVVNQIMEYRNILLRFTVNDHKVCITTFLELFVILEFKVYCFFF